MLEAGEARAVRMTPPEFAARLYAFGALGVARAVKRDDLARRLHVSGRELRSLCEEARLAGWFIGYSTKSPGGIYAADTDDERMAIIEQISATCRHRLRQRSALRRSLRARGQKHLPFRD